ncbi:uncharacterized protein LOC107641056 [Arachis ipaensis]|uniref:uncharacterized protein LOC107641056 n=1 Tax=Arachis ipaensis TaxID=130454 RepID=UPI0007AF1B0B|nr:uncharacterized protein LOC107641056 [Arachis ipaensis]
MDECYDYLYDVNAKQLTWNFKVYVVRLWESPSKFNEKEVGSIEMILQDIKGDRIRASIPNPVLKKWLGNIQEFCMYMMSNFIVVDNKIKSRVTSVKWVLTFSHWTIVSPVENPSYFLEAFQLKTISELLNAEKLENTELFDFDYTQCVFFLDMIAEVVGKEDPRELVTNNGKEIRRLTVILEDLEGNKIGYTLFGETVDHLFPHLEDVIVVKTKPRGRIKFNDRTEGQEPYQIDDLTPTKMMADTGEPITLRSAIMNDDIIDLGIDADTLPPEDDDLQ